MSIINIQTFNCPYDESMEYSIKFQNLPITDEDNPYYLDRLVIPSYLNYYIGITGDIIVRYSGYDQNNPEHVAEFERIQADFIVTDHSNGKISVFIDFDNYSVNEWKTYSTQQSSWVSDKFNIESISPGSKNVILHRVITDKETEFKYCKINNASMELSNNSTKQAIIYGNLINIEDANGSRIISTNTRKTQTISGNATFQCDNQGYILVIEL